MENSEKQPRIISIVEANLAQVKWLNDMIDRHLEKGTRQDSLTIRQMEYQREKYLKEIYERRV